MIYRREIDGLRAVAVMPVILFHAGFETFSGGFVGVDVFFVISGYLITSIILEEQQAGRFSLRRFYERRARRILPALFLVMAACVLPAWLILLPEEMKAFSRSLASVTLFSSNILFWSESGYFDPGAELKPLFHTWSLAVEEQFYVFFPLFLILVWRTGRKGGIAALAIIALISLVWAEWATVNRPAAAFYLLPMRAWELLMGAFIAIHCLAGSKAMNSVDARQPAVAGMLHQCAAALGLAMIFVAVFAFDKDTPFPGIYALVPTIGAALVILFAQAQTVVGALLGSRALVGIGLISYSAYLWHQPLLAFARQWGPVHPAMLLVLCAAALAFAYLSWRYVETPCRSRDKVGGGPFLAGALGLSVLFLAIGVAGHFHGGFSMRHQVDEAFARDFRAHGLRDKCKEGLDETRGEVNVCVLGDVSSNASPAMAVFGDSHALALLPAFDAIARESGRPFAFLGLDGCPPLLNVDVMRGNFVPGVCSDLSARQYEYVKAERITTVFLVSRWSLYTDGSYGKGMEGSFLVEAGTRDQGREISRRSFEKSLAETIDAYRALGVAVHVVAQVPMQQTLLRQLYHRLYDEGLLGSDEAERQVVNSAIGMGSHAEIQKFTRDLLAGHERRGAIRLIILDGNFCDTDRCVFGNRHHSYYRDYSHLNERGAMRVKDSLQKYWK